MTKEKKAWFACTNCMGEYGLNDLGVYLDKETNHLSYFCPFCGWREFVPSEEFDWDDEANITIAEKGPAKVYPYPDPIIKHSPAEFYIKYHNQRIAQDGS